MNEPLTINERIVIPAADLSYEFSRSGGPGGQHVNTADTRVRLRFALRSCAVLHFSVKDRIRNQNPGRVTDDGELILVSQNNRSRHRNIEVARERLAALVLAALKPPKKRRPTKPSRNARKRRMDSKKKRGQIKKNRGKVDY